MATLEVLDGSDVISVSFEDVLKYHGRSSIGGVAHGFKALERVLPLLDSGRPPDRYGVAVETAFPGPGARDAFEMVLRAVTGDRYRVDTDLDGGAGAPEAPEGRYFFRFAYRGAAVEATLRPGHVLDEFVALVRRGDRTAADEERLVACKEDMAARLMALPAAEVYDAAPAVPGD